MKSTLLCAILFFSIAFGSFAQTKSKPVQQINPTKTAVTISTADNKPIVLLGSKEYSVIKAEGRLAHYEVKHREGKITSVIKTVYNAKSPLSSGLTPCDVVPPGTTPPFAAPEDDQTYFDETGAYIQLPFTFCFYGNSYTEVNYSSNGNIQFPPTNNGAFSSTGFPTAPDQMIAPFWADCDNRGTGSYFIDVFSTYAVFTWQNVGYYNSHSDLTNDFQMVITDGLDPILPPGKNVGFYYGTMQWTTGDASDGVNGFPDPTSTTPPIPATVGANAGNGIDYFLIGRFGQPGASYDGPLGADDGVSWLDGKRFFFNACPPIGANQEPLNLTGGFCDTMKVCGNDTLYKKYTFSAPEVSQSVTVTASAPTLGAAFSYSVLPNTNSTDIYMIIDGSLAPGGYHTVTMSATDNGAPPLTSNQTFVVYVNQAALNNLNGTIVLTPTLGACPGGTVAANVTVSGGIPDSYLWSNNETTAATSFTTVVPADSLIFVTLTSGQCQKSILGHININPVPVVAISGNTSFCSGNASNTILTATNTLNPASQGPHTYSWVGTGTIGSANSPSTTLNAGTYTVTVTNQFGCLSSASTTVVLNETPDYSLASSNAISGGSVYCVNQDTARIGINFATSLAPPCGFAISPCVTSNNVQIGTGNTTNGNTSYPCPYGNYYKNTRQQYLFTAAELSAQGLVAGKISSLGFIVDNILPLNTSGFSSSSTYIGTLPNYTIKLKCTSATDLTPIFEDTGLMQVFNSNYTPVVGTNTHNFTQSYVWDGVSNILVDICYDLTPIYTSNPNTEYTTTANTSAHSYFNDNTIACGYAPTTATFDNVISSDRPNVIFSNCLSQQSGSQFDIVVTPSVGVVIPAAHDSIMFDLPATAGITCYTVSLVNPLGGCSKDTVICINALQGVTQATLNASSMVICPSETITLSPSGTITSYTISYVDGSGAHISDNAPVTFTPSSVPGTFVYTLSATAPCGGPLTDFTTTVTVAQGITQGTLTTSSASVCPGDSVTLGPLGSLQTYTIQYDDGSGLQSSVNSTITIVPTNTTSPVFGIHTYSLIAQGPCSGPIDTFYVDVNVTQGLTQATLTATQYSVCPGSSTTLDAGNTLSTYTIQYDTGSGVQSSVNSSVTIVPTNTTSPVFGIHTYTLIGQGFCSAPIDTFYVDVTVIQGVTQGTLSALTATVCPGSSITLDALGALDSYTITYVDATGTHTVANAQASFVPSSIATPQFGIHTYTLEAVGPCSGPLTVFTTTVEVVQGTSQATITATPNAVCIGNPITLNVIGSLASYTIQYNNGAGVISSNGPVTFNTAVAGVNTYTVLAEGFCSAPVTPFVTTASVTALANLTIAPMPNMVKCLSGSSVLTANVGSSTPGNPGTPYTYLWTVGGSPAVGTNTNSSYTSNASVTTTYVVTASGPCAISATSSVVVSNFVNDLTVSIIDSASVCATTEFHLNAFASGGVPAYTYDWALLPGTGSIGSGSNLTATSPGSQGTYTVIVMVSDSCGYTDSDIQLINVLPPCDLVIPNIITPNGDNVNDAFKIKNLEYHPNTNLTVYDRWGRNVYESSNYANDWKADGVSDGTFFYILDVPDDKKYTGYLTIFKGN